MLRENGGGRRTYGICGDEMIGAGDARHGVAVEEALDVALDGDIIGHESDVSGVETEQEKRLVPADLLVQEKDDQDQEADAVEGAVAEERPPRQRQHRFAEQGAHADDEENVEDGRAHDGPDAHVVLGHEHADDAGEQLGSAAAGRHERSAGHVVRDLEPFDDDLQRRHEELVADDGQRHEHVHAAGDVQHHGALLPLLLREQIRREVVLRRRRRRHRRRRRRRHVPRRRWIAAVGRLLHAVAVGAHPHPLTRFFGAQQLALLLLLLLLLLMFVLLLGFVARRSAFAGVPRCALRKPFAFLAVRTHVLAHVVHSLFCNKNISTIFIDSFVIQLYSVIIKH